MKRAQKQYLKTPLGSWSPDEEHGAHGVSLTIC